MPMPYFMSNWCSLQFFVGVAREGSSYYNVVLKEIWVQGEPLPVKPSVFDGRYGTILDSGTTFAYLPEKAFNVFKNALIMRVWSTEDIAI